MMKENFTNYGPLWELWWDGANGEGPDGKKQQYDWPRFRETVRKYSPGTLVFSDVGPDIRWVGNEKGIAGETNWNLLNTDGFTPGAGAPPADTLTTGNVNGKNWIPAECDVSIRPGWFYHPEEDNKVKSPEVLFQLYLRSVGRGANLLLNVPPGRDGRIQPADSLALAGFHRLLENNFAENKSAEARAELHYKGLMYPGNLLIDGNAETINALPDYHEGSYWIKFNPVEKINCIVLRENLQYGQQIRQLKISLVNGTTPAGEFRLTTIGHKRIITFPARNISGIRIVIEDAKDNPLLGEVETYLINEKLVNQ